MIEKVVRDPASQTMLSVVKGGGTAIVYIKQASGDTINSQADCWIESSVQDKEAGVRCEVVIVMTDYSHHQPIGFLPLSFSFSDDQQDHGGSLRSSSGSVNDMLDLMMEEGEEEEEGDGVKDCDQAWCESVQQEEVTTRARIDNKMNVERCEIRANDNFSSKEPGSHVNTFGNSVQLSSQACFDVDNDEGETTGITNTWIQLRTVNLTPQ